MATQEQILKAFQILYENRPQKNLEEINKIHFGVMAAVRYLHEHPDDTKSSDLCKALGVSSARMAILLKKLEAKQLIIRSECPNDARATLIRLSDKGSRLTLRLEQKMTHALGRVIDEIGLEELELMMSKFSHLRDIFKELETTNMED